MVTLSHRLWGWALVSVVLFAFTPGRVSGGPQCPPDPAARSRTAQKSLNLYTKDPATWKVVSRGAKGVLSFDESTGVFTFTARKLEPLKGYSLVRHDDGETLGDLLAKGFSDKEGELGLTGTWRLWRGKIWLVPSNHTAQSAGRLRLTAWRPGRILFEEKVLGVVYPCSDKK